MTTELWVVQFWWFQIELALRTRSILKIAQTKIALHSVQLLLEIFVSLVKIFNNLKFPLMLYKYQFSSPVKISF